MAVMREAMELKYRPHLISHDTNDEKHGDFIHSLDLPHDLISHGIFIRLPIKSLLRFKAVSKQWYSTLSSSHFGTTHFKFSPFYKPIDCLFVQSGNDYFLYSYEGESDVDIDCDKGLFKLDIDFDGLQKDRIFVIGTCNGLLCLYSLLGCLIIWNPVIHQWVKFQCPLMENCKKSTWGFGYVSLTDDYKVVRLSECSGEILVHVFSLRTKKWKQVHDGMLHQYLIRGASASAGLLINESLYWIMHRQDGDYDEQDILGFDLVLEKFVRIHGLVPSNSYVGWVRFLCSMGGCLSMGRFTSRGDGSISISMQHGQVEYVGMYRDLNLGSCCAAVGFTRDGKFFIQLGQNELGLVDPNTSPIKYTPLVKFKGEGFIDINGYAPSLISPLAVAGAQNE